MPSDYGRGNDLISPAIGCACRLGLPAAEGTLGSQLATLAAELLASFDEIMNKSEAHWRLELRYKGIESTVNDEPIDTIRDALESGRLTINALDDGSGVLLDIDGEQLLTLNRTGMRLIQTIDDGAATIEVLRDMLLNEFEVEPGRAESDARAFVEDVAEAL